MKILLKLSALALGLAMASTVSYADTVSMNFNSVGGASNGTDYIYPYNFSINGSSTLTALMCVSYEDEIYQGESWTATTSAITTASSFIDQEDAYLFSLLGDSAFSANDIQEAAWYLSDPGGAVPTTSEDPALLADAAIAVVSADHAGGSSPSFDNGQYTLYTAVAGSQDPATDGAHKNFVGASPVPEPGSLLLLATALLGFA